MKIGLFPDFEIHQLNGITPQRDYRQIQCRISIKVPLFRWISSKKKYMMCFEIPNFIAGLEQIRG